MPFPWKKAKVTRITRMVADLQPSKRGGSLVVETGFPTSIIDLFVKNRDKLRRNSVRRKKKKSTYVDGELCIGSPVMVEERFVVSARPESAGSTVFPEPDRELAAVAVAVMAKEVEERKMEERGAVESYFLAAVRVFVVTALALSTKKLAIGVTLSAFVLLFLEFVGKGVIVLLMRRFRAEKGDGHEDDEEEFVAVRDLVNLRSPSEELLEVSSAPSTVNSRSSGDEIWGSSTVNSRDDEVFRPQLEILSRGRKWGSLDSGSEEAGQFSVPSLEKTRSKKSKIRRKIIKNIVPKTLRKSKRWKKLKSGKAVEEEEQDEHEEQEEEEEGEISEEQEVEEVSELSVLAEDDEAGEEQEEAGIAGRKSTWVAAATLMVVLLGLFEGRILSVLLTLIWCFAVKVVGIGTRERPAS